MEKLLRAGLTVLMLAGTLGVGTASAQADTLSVSPSSTSSPTGIPVTITVNNTASPTSSTSGHGPSLYLVVEPATAGKCLATYGQNQQVVGSQDDVLSGPYSNEVKTGQSTESFSDTQYQAGTYTICAWLETDDSDSPNSGDTSSVVTATATASFNAVNTDTLAAAFSTATPAPNTPLTITFTGNATPIDASGHGPYLYAVAQPAGAGGCQPTYGQDEQVAGDQWTVLSGDYGTEVNTGQFSEAYTFTGKTGHDEVCAWLETDNSDNSSSGDTSSVVEAGTGAVPFTVGTPEPPAPTVTTTATLVTVTAPPPLQPLLGSLSWHYRFRGGRTRLTGLSFVRINNTSTVTVSCHGGGCPFGTLRSNVSRLRALEERFGRGAFLAGDVLTIRVSAPGHPSAVIQARIRRGGPPVTSAKSVA